MNEKKPLQELKHSLDQLAGRILPFFKKLISKSEHEKNVVALEFLENGAKLVKMSVARDRHQLLKAKSVLFESPSDKNEEEKKWKEALLKLLEGEKLEDQTLLLSVNSPHACFGKFVLPKIPHKELSEILKWKMQDILPFPPEEAVLDQRLFEIPGTENEPRYTALVIATPHGFANRFLRVLFEAGFPSFIPVYSSFTISTFPRAFDLPARHLVAVVDIGYTMTEINLYEGGRLCFVRKIAFGEQLINQVLTQSLVSERGRVSLSFEEAKHAMYRERILDSQNKNMVAGKIEASKLYALVRPEFEKLIGELQRSFDYYTQEHGEGIERVFITGGGSRLMDFSEFLEKELDIPVKPLRLDDDLTVKDPSCRTEELPMYYRLISLMVDRKDTEISLLADFERSAEKVVRTLSYPKVAFTVLWIIAALFGGLFWREKSIRHKTALVRAQMVNLEPGFEFAKKVHAIENQIKQSKQISNHILEREPFWREVFSELSHFTPRGVILSSVSYMDHAFILRGNIYSASSETVLSNFIISLEGAIFKKVTLVSVEKKPEQKTAVFTIRCEVQ